MEHIAPFFRVEEKARKAEIDKVPCAGSCGTCFSVKKYEVMFFRNVD
jgi:hypothetical protein